MSTSVFERERRLPGLFANHRRCRALARGAEALNGLRGVAMGRTFGPDVSRPRSHPKKRQKPVRSQPSCQTGNARPQAALGLDKSTAALSACRPITHTPLFWNYRGALSRISVPGGQNLQDATNNSETTTARRLDFSLMRQAQNQPSNNKVAGASVSTYLTDIAMHIPYCTIRIYYRFSY